MKEYYENSIQMIRYLNIKLTRKQYSQLAKRFNLLSPDSLEYISKKRFKKIVLENIA